MPLRILALLARDHGLEGLKTLVNTAGCEVVTLATHRRLPRSEDPLRAERSDFKEFESLSTQHNIPLLSVDSKDEQQALEVHCQKLKYDLLVAISWRRWIPPTLIDAASLGSINLHRGKLPDYAGAEPIKQALLAGDDRITITAHEIVEEVDAGPILCHVEHLITQSSTENQEQQISRLKHEITPLFGPLLLQSIEQLQAQIKL